MTNQIKGDWHTSKSGVNISMEACLRCVNSYQSVCFFLISSPLFHNFLVNLKTISETYKKMHMVT